MKSAEKEAATTMTIDEPTQASAHSTNTGTGWRCYHPNNHHSQDAAQTTAARAKAQKQHPENEHVNRVGEQWHAQFRRIAREKGVTDEKLDQLDKTHLQRGSQEQLMRALKALMAGAEDECVDVAPELAEQQGISAEVLTAMAKYAATNSCEFDSVAGAEAEAQSMESVHAEPWKTDRTGHQRMRSESNSHGQTEKARRLSLTRRPR
jgi:hypothetical protein